MAWSRLFCVSAQSRGTRARVRSLSASVKAATACSRRAGPRSRAPRVTRAAPRLFCVIAQSRSTRARVPSLSVWRVHVRPGVLDLGFMARLLSLCSLPRRNPGSQLRYIRRNGPYTLAMTAGVNNKLPYGNLPRLLLAWVCTEAVRTQNSELILGRSLADFMRSVGVYDDGGAVRRRLRNQMQRLFRSHVELVYEDAHGSRFVNSAIADGGEFWWDVKRPDQPALWESKIELGEKFFHEVITNPIPLDLHILKAVKRSPLGLDLYLWLTYRTFALKRPLRLTWPLLYRQFGADPARAGEATTVQNFRKDCLRELKKIKMAWPDLHYRTATGALLLLPSPPRIPPSQLRLVE